MERRLEERIKEDRRKQHGGETFLVSRQEYIRQKTTKLVDAIIENSDSVKKLAKLEKEISKFANALSAEERVKVYMSAFDDYVEILKEVGAFKISTRKTIADDLSNLAEEISVLAGKDYQEIGTYVDYNGLLRAKAQVLIVTDYLTFEDAKVISKQIRKSYGEDKIPQTIVELSGSCLGR
ncbi:MAG: hypothetical protein IJ542_00500 [Clostridia bacterium]|nr:hypothetical protein [Clostridia bacterium]